MGNTLQLNKHSPERPRSGSLDNNRTVGLNDEESKWSGNKENSIHSQEETSSSLSSKRNIYSAMTNRVLRSHEELIHKSDIGGPPTKGKSISSIEAYYAFLTKKEQEEKEREKKLLKEKSMELIREERESRFEENPSQEAQNDPLHDDRASNSKYNKFFNTHTKDMKKSI
jgi:hypothetical protein